MSVEPHLEIEQDLAKKVRLATVVAEGIKIDDGAALWAVFQPFCEELAARYRDLSPGDVPGVQAARKLYHAIGLDPTKVRPSSEALLRRVLKGKPLYRINSLVDTINYCSLSFLLPIGLYDLDRLEGERILLRKGAPGEHFEGIRKDTVNLENRYALFDSVGPFGSPSSDSLRTSITESTTRSLVVIFAPFEIVPKVLAHHAQYTAEQIARFGGSHPETRLCEIVS